MVTDRLIAACIPDTHGSYKLTVPKISGGFGSAIIDELMTFCAICVAITSVDILRAHPSVFKCSVTTKCDSDRPTYVIYVNFTMHTIQIVYARD
jgi:hypothetical protein